MPDKVTSSIYSAFLYPAVLYSVLSINLYQYTKLFQCDMSTFIYTNSLTNISFLRFLVDEWMGVLKLKLV